MMRATQGTGRRNIIKSVKQTGGEGMGKADIENERVRRQLIKESGQIIKKKRERKTGREGRERKIIG
ncbi:hypothetical protein [Candidatus Vidania fulgoroideorum]